MTGTTNGDFFGAVESEACRVMVIEEFQGQNAHFDQVGTVDAFEAGGDYRADAQEQGPLAAQSRELPAPYSLPAMMTAGVPDCL